MENFVNIEFYRSTNKNIFSLIFHCAGTESKFYFKEILKYASTNPTTLYFTVLVDLT